MKIITIFDDPWEQCDKKWLYEKLLQKNIETIKISPKKELYSIEIKNRIGYMYAMCTCLWMSMKAVLYAKPGDTIIGWKSISGMFASLLAPKKVNVIALSFLTPQPNDKLRFLRKKTMEKENTWIGVNCLKTKKQLIGMFGEQSSDRIFWIPDVPKTNYFFEKIEDKNVKYCFTGGKSNRDWRVLLDVAKNNREINFQCVAIEKKYKESVAGNTYPENMEVFFQLTEDDYYSKLRNAYIMVLPLKDERVAGLTDLIKAVGFGVLPLTSRNEAIEQYYPEHLRDILQFEVGNCQELSKKIRQLYEISFAEYEAYITSLREHLIKNFTSDVAIDCIMKVIKEQ